MKLYQTFETCNSSPCVDHQSSSSKLSLYSNEMTEHEEFVGNLRTITNLLTWNLSLLGEHLKKVGLLTMSFSILFHRTPFCSRKLEQLTCFIPSRK